MTYKQIFPGVLIAGSLTFSLFAQSSELEAKLLAEAGQSSGPVGGPVTVQFTAMGQAVPDELKLLQEKRTANVSYVMSSEFIGNKILKDKPYEAEAVTEMVQVLGDSNRITRRSVSKQYRDQNGRTRREEAGPPNSPATFIFISDPVAKVDYVIDSSAKTVRRISRSEGTAAGGGAGTIAMRSTVMMDRLPLKMIAAAQSDSKKEDLGKRTIESLECTGTRTTMTIAAGQIGNELPIITTTESWYSPEIEAVVQSTTTDPRFGNTTYNLRGVQRGNLPLSLFEQPADYAVQTENIRTTIITK